MIAEFLDYFPESYVCSYSDAFECVRTISKMSEVHNIICFWISSDFIDVSNAAICFGMFSNGV